VKWQEKTDRHYKGEVEEALFPGQLKRSLEGKTIAKVSDVTGRPGGPNNDAVTFTLDNGAKLRIDAYSGGDMYATYFKAS